MSDSELPNAQRRAVLGLFLGLWVAACFSLISAVIWFLNGRSLGYLDVTLKETIVFYVVWAAPIGVIVGLLLPLTRKGVGAAAVGSFIMTSAYLSYWWMFERSVDALLLTMLVVFGMAVGGLSGYRLFPRYWSWIRRVK